MTALWFTALAVALGVNPIIFGLLCAILALQVGILIVVSVRR